jgi:hypothetical protein
MIERMPSKLCFGFFGGLAGGCRFTGEGGGTEEGGGDVGDGCGDIRIPSIDPGVGVAGPEYRGTLLLFSGFIKSVSLYSLTPGKL